jgi:hypothetical protein
MEVENRHLIFSTQKERLMAVEKIQRRRVDWVVPMVKTDTPQSIRISGVQPINELSNRGSIKKPLKKI